MDDNLEYEVRFKTAQGKEQVDFLTKAVNELDTSVLRISKRNIGVFEKQFAKAADPLQEAVETIKVFDSELDKIQKKIRLVVATQGKAAARGLISREKTLQNRRASAIVAAQQTPAITDRINQINTAYSTPVIKSDFDLKLNKNIKSLKDGRIAVKELKNETDKLSESSKKGASSWSKLLGRIKNIAIYRTIRTVMRVFTRGISEGLQGLAQYSGEVDDSLSNIKNSFSQVTNTLAVSVASLLQSLEPILTYLSDALVDIVNAFNRALAKAQGKNFYYQAKKAADSYAQSAKQAQKLSFDAFEALSGNGSTATKDLFEKVYFSAEAKEAAGDIEAQVETIDEKSQELSSIFEGVIEVFKVLWDLLQDLLDVIKPYIKPLLAALKDLLIQLKPVLTKLAEVITQALVDAIQVIADGIRLLTGGQREDRDYSAYGWFEGTFRRIMDNAGDFFTSLGNLLLGWTGIRFADGGFTTANFIATNENGRREWVGRSAGATAVVNDTQMSDIMYGAVRDGCYQGILQAMYDNGGNSSSGEITIRLDSEVIGRAVADSAGFRNEFNRRNIGNSAWTGGRI